MPAVLFSEQSNRSKTLAAVQVLTEFRPLEGESAATLDANGDGSLLVVLDLTEDESLLETFWAREVVNRIQKLRKAAGLTEGDKVDMWVTALGDAEPLQQLGEKLRSQVRNQARGRELVADCAELHEVGR